MMDARTKNRPSPLPLMLASFRGLHASISVVRRALQWRLFDCGTA
jgi:hypothetical protein